MGDFTGSIQGGTGGRLASAAALQQLLQSAPDDALCDACLALACDVSLIEMRELTEAMLRAEPQTFRRGLTCASCRRTVPSISSNPDKTTA